MKISEIAELLNGPWEGNDIDIAGVASLEEAGANELAFVSNRKAAAQSESSRAGCLLVTEDFPRGRTLIRVADPRSAFARVVRQIYPGDQPEPGIHPRATIASTTRIGARARIGAGSVIGPRVSIGDDCVIHANVTIYHDVVLGHRVVLHSGCVLGADGFGFVMAGDRYEKFPQIGRVEIGDDVEIGANSCIDRAALGVTQIGSGTKLDNMVHVAHNCRIGKHVVVAAQTGFSGGVVVEDYAVIGGQVGIGDKARIETRAVLGSGCGILTSKIVRKGQVVWGTPARPLREYLEQLANLARLPQLRREVTEIKRHLAALQKL
ncbi:MAG: UDP-3-O-(3-hydroxymyristoyl)glucosamine N-acyltransferase [Bryobacteraceae bacterium]